MRFVSTRHTHRRAKLWEIWRSFVAGHPANCDDVRMRERPWYRLHWLTWVAVLAVGTALVLAQFEDRGEAFGFEESGYDQILSCHGWPRAFYTRISFGQLGYNEVRFEWSFHNACQSGAMCLTLILSTLFVAQAFSLKKRFTLLTLLTLPLIVGLVLAFSPFRFLFQVGQAGNELPWQYGPPLIFGESCTIYAIGWIAIAVYRRAISTKTRTLSTTQVD